MSENKLSPISFAAQKEAGTPYYGLVWLALADIAYTDEKTADIKNVAVDLSKNIAALPDPPAPAGFDPPSPGSWGKWQVDWGPVVDTVNSNLMYVASYREIANGLPVVDTVCIRGTDISATSAGVIKQLREDLDVETLVSWSNVMNPPDPSHPCPGGASATDVAIAQGTCLGLRILQRFQAKVNMQNPPPVLQNAVDVLSYVQWLATIYSGLPIVVTGHSLGGCLTTVMAVFLSDSLTAANVTAAIVPHPFAPPTAGTIGFAKKFDDQFPGAQVWWNTLDVVPNAFQNIKDAPPTTPSLTNILNLWSGYDGPSIPLVEHTLLKLLIRTVPAYAQPAGLQTLQGSVPQPQVAGNDWLKELIIQHRPPVYHHLIATQMAGTVAAYPLPQLTPNANAFDDKDLAQQSGSPVTGMTIRYGDILNAIQATNGVWDMPQHGGGSGAEASPTLDPGDTIIEVSGYTGTWFSSNCVLQLTLKTKNGKTYGPYGSMAHATSQVPFSYVAPPGQALLAFCGTTINVRLADGSMTDIIASLGTPVW